ncbi:MAG: AraC family transcriptional regulator [Candidatus Limnocylindria bacterium]
MPGFGIAELSFPPGLRLAPHDHDRATIAVVVAGAFQGWWNGSEGHCPAGTLVVEPAGERHANRFHDRSGARVVIVQPEVETPRLHQPAGRRSRRRPDALALAWRIHEELARPDEVTALAMEGLALEISAAAIRDATPPSADRALLDRAVLILEERYAQPIGLSEVAAGIGMHPGHLARAFRRGCGRSVGTYLREVRVRRAAERLAHGSESLAEIALAVGFADQSHLTRWFLRYVGVTPARYRAIQRGG